MEGGSVGPCCNASTLDLLFSYPITWFSSHSPRLISARIVISTLTAHVPRWLSSTGSSSSAAMFKVALVAVWKSCTSSRSLDLVRLRHSWLASSPVPVEIFRKSGRFVMWIKRNSVERQISQYLGVAL